MLFALVVMAAVAFTVIGPRTETSTAQAGG